MNYILKNENAAYYECGFSCDNEIFLRFGSEAFFITDSRYTLEAKQKIKNAKVLEARDLFKCARNIIKKSKIKKIGYDPQDWSCKDFDLLKHKTNVHFYKKENFSQKKRIIKSEKEIKIIKKAVKLGAEGFDAFAKFLCSKGKEKSEKRLNYEATRELCRQGELDLSFSPITALNENAAKPHALPSKKTLKQGDLLLVDAGVKFKRYCSDRTRTAEYQKGFDFKKIQKFKDKKRQKIYDTVLKAQEAAIKFAKHGVKAYEIDKTARDVIEKAGYGKYFIHSTGHGVGLDIHELPVISRRSKTTIEENMVFTIEPGIYIPNEFGVRIEDMVRVRANGVEIL